MKVFQQNPDNLDERLAREAYGQPALVPASPWLPATVYLAPVVASRIDSVSGNRVVELSLATSTANSPWLWAIQTRSDSGWTTDIAPGVSRTRVIGTRGGAAALEIRVRAVDRVGNAGPETRLSLLP
jgi:hypothetical protein